MSIQLIVDFYATTCSRSVGVSRIRLERCWRAHAVIIHRALLHSPRRGTNEGMVSLRVLLCVAFLDLISDFCHGFDVCNNLIDVEHDLDKNGNVLACRYEILKFDPSGVFLREAVSTPVNKTLCHELRNADTCNPDGSLVTCHHVPKWERYPEGEFNPPEGCTFSQNLQCEMETICLSATEKPVTVRTTGNMKTGRDKTTLNGRTGVPTNRPVLVSMRTDITTVGTEDFITEKKEKSQHVVIDVKRLTTAEPSSAGNNKDESIFLLILSLLSSLFLINKQVLSQLM